MSLDRKSFSVVIASGAAASSTAITFDASNSPAKITRILVSVPNWTTAVCAVASVVDDSSFLVYQSALLDENAKHSVPVNVDVYPGDTLILASNADHGTATVPATTGYVHLEDVQK